MKDCELNSGSILALHAVREASPFMSIFSHNAIWLAARP
jgi:hypothetical protein